ncbi:transcription-associated protein 1 [Lecanora helva]
MEKNIDAFAARLGDPNLELQKKVHLATEMRDNIDVLCTGTAYPIFLKRLIPVFAKILEGPPAFMSTSSEHKLRNCILEIFHRLPMSHSEAFKQHAAQIADLLLSMVRVENEDNAILGMKTIMDLERHQPEATASKVQPFLDLILDMFKAMEHVVKDTFDSPAQGLPNGTTTSNPQSFQSPRPGSPAVSASADLGFDTQTARQLLSGMKSFKVFAECPIIVVSLFQAHRNCVPPNVKRFVPCIKDVLKLEAAPQARAHEAAKERGEIFTGVCKEIRNRAAFGELINAQVKMMSFLAYLLRVYYQQLQDFLPVLPDIVIRLLRDCPSEKSSTRKELLVAIRHTINFNFRKIFLSKLDDLLDERTLIGDGLTVYETMRPLAYSLLADLIHHIRESLSRDQIRKTVNVFSKNLHDVFPGTSFQTMSAKLLLNLADCIANIPNKKDARHFLIMILSAIGDKFADMNRQYQNSVKLSKDCDSLSVDAIPEDHLADAKSTPDWDEVDIFTATPIKMSNPKDRGANPVEDNKFLFKNLLTGLKGMFYQLKVCNPEVPVIEVANAPTNWHEVSHGYNAEEVGIIKKLFREGAHVFRYYSLEKPFAETNYSSPVEFLTQNYGVQSGKEEKDLLETFATVFHSIDPATFHEIFHSEIPQLYHMMFEHPALLHVPQFFLASEATSPAFAGMLLQFLMDRIGEVGTSDIKKSSILLRMFKLSFMAVTLFSQANEQVLLPHVTKIVTQSIQLSTSAEEPMNYFYLLRSLFRSIGGGRFELLYKEILPLLEMLLQVLNNLLTAARKPQERDLYVELCLTVPARLSNLLPHLSYLMRPLVVALRAGSDLVGQGLRTLELCVDNLTAEYLDPIMAPVIDELMMALWEHLKPNPYSHFHAHTTMRILGKLGGRNRKFLNGPPSLQFQDFADDQYSFDIRLIGSNKERAFPSSLGIDLAIAKLSEIPKTPAAKKADPYYKQQAFKLISAQLKLQIGFDNLPEDFARLVRLRANDLLDDNYDIRPDMLQLPDREKSLSKRECQQKTLKDLLKALMIAKTLPDLEGAASALLGDICRHFTILEVGKALFEARQSRKEFDVEAGEGPLCLDSRVIADAIAEQLSSDKPAVREAAESSIQTILDATATILGSSERVEKLPFFSHLAKVFAHKCYEEDWYVKAGGGLGIHLLATKFDFGDEWMIARQLDFLRALLFVVKDMPADLPSDTRVRAASTMEVVLRRCNNQITKEDVASAKDPEVPTKPLRHLLLFFVPELMHASKNVREVARKALTSLADMIGVEVSELISPLKDRLLSPIYMKPLRALPNDVQVGFLDGITYCMSLQRNLIEFNGDLNRLLIEAMALSEAEDEALAPKPHEYKNADNITNLRVACIKLLSLAVGFSEFAGQQQSASRSRTISIFFKSLYSTSTEVIDAANAGLKGVLSHTNKLPKDLLQNGLRPILMNLQDSKKLSVPGLDGLARLLTLLTNYFKTEIGERLLMHMTIIADSSVLQKSSFSLIEQNPQMKILLAILNVFHLLPSSAAMFLNDLIERVLELEKSLRRTHFSPFREPLLKYINRYPKEASHYFMERLSDMKYGRFFGQILAASRSGPLRDVVISEMEGLTKASFSLADVDKQDAACINAIHAIHSLCDHSFSWLAQQDALRQTLLRVGKDLNRKRTLDTIHPDLRLCADQASEQLMDILVKVLELAPKDFDFLFQVIDAVTSEDIKEHPSLFRFIYRHIICADSVDYWRSLVMRSLDLYSLRGSSFKTKTFAFRYLVNPIFAMDTMRSLSSQASTTPSRRLIDKSIVDSIHNRIWKPQLTETNEENTQSGADHSRLELLQMSALLLKWHHNLVSEARKELIKFGWTYIRLEDIINKHASYVLVGLFIAQFETPVKIINQIYLACLKAHQNEGRALIVQALDLIAPVLPKRMKDQSDPRYPTWAKWPKRIMSEESSNLQQMIGIYQFMVRHPRLFYESRENFVPTIIPSLSKLAQLPNPSNEHKKLVLNLIHMILDWESRRVHASGDRPASHSSEPSPLKKRKLEQVEGGSTSPAASFGPSSSMERTEYQISTPLRAVLIKYLAQFISVLPERYPVSSVRLRDLHSSTTLVLLHPNEMCRKAVGLFHDLLSPMFWSGLDVDLFPKISEQILCSEKTDKGDEKTATSIINTLQILRVVINMKSDDWIIAQLPHIHRLLEKPMKMDNAEIQDCLHAADKALDGDRDIRPMVQRILEAIPEEAREDDEMEIDTPAKDFMNFITGVASTAMSEGNLVAAIYIYETLAKTRPKEIDTHIPHIMRALQQKLSKDQFTQQGVHPGIPPGVGSGEGSAGVLDEREMELSTQLILKSIWIISSRMATLGDQRRPFLSVLASLVERSQNTKLCERILQMVEVWVFESTDPWPTLKEKTAVLHKMLLFEARSDQTLLHKFLDLVIRIYEDPKITRTELTVRLEHAFLVGTRANDVDMRNRFMTIFNRSLTRTVSARLMYVLTSQNWDTLAESFWLSQAIQLIFGAIDMGSAISLDPEDFKIMPPKDLFGVSSNDNRKDDLMLDETFEDFMSQHRRFYVDLGDVRSRDILEPLCQLQHTSADVAYQIWIALFPLCWSALSRDDRGKLEEGLVSLLTKDYHQRQVDRRPNVIQALLEGNARTEPKCKIPPHVVKYLCKTYDAWYTTAISLEAQAMTPLIDSAPVRESNLDALVEVYSGLQEDDFFYGTWRRRCRFVETNAALSYEQCGEWTRAQGLYDAAQIKARIGATPYSQGEYMLWEDHWTLCAQKLQQWDVLNDFAKHENYNDLLLESSWRNLEMWSGLENLDQLSGVIKAVSDAPTPRRTFFQAFMSLLKFHEKQEPAQEFSRICDESIQLSIRKWHQLPNRITNAHIPILQNFQQLVELHDANIICISLSQTNQANLDGKSQELKLLLGTWRDRLPNVWDDINAWQDLVTWRQHIFTLINRTYLALLGPQQSNATGNSYAYRGYHETAWIINRFAHVARKHRLPDVCISQLSKIYTLPNIEIQEAFLKLREQAKCHYQNKEELNSGLEVINNTNLNYFGQQQKAEFFTLKGMFLAKLNDKEQANDAFGTALYYDIRLPKAWAEWGYYNDTMFKQEPDNMERAAAAVSCYLEAAGLFKNGKSRKLLSRILWLLSIDGGDHQVSKAFEEFKGETPIWYWITFIPQLLTSLNYQEAALTRNVLIKIAKVYPQSLFFLLRTTREDMLSIKKAEDQKKLRLSAAKQQSPNVKQGSPESTERRDSSSRPGTAVSDAIPNGNSTSEENTKTEPDSQPNGMVNGEKQQATEGGPESSQKRPWEYSEEIMAVLKASFPLLAYSMEAMVDQIQKQFKCPPDEDAYRLIVALLNDALSYIGRTPSAYSHDFKLPAATENNIKKFSETILPPHIRSSFEEDFVREKPNMSGYIHKLRKWRDKFEEKLDRRPQTSNLEQFSISLSEFRFAKFDDVEVPGQYLQHRDKNNDFIRIERFLPNVDLVRTIGFSHRRLKIRGHDGSVHPFAVQHPAARHSRREERILQLFRIFNGTLAKRKESRRRNLNFFLPLVTPLAPSLRLVQDDASSISLQGVYEDYCRRNGQNKDDPILFTMGKLNSVEPPNHAHNAALRMEIYNAIKNKWVPPTIALEYFQATYPSYPDFFLFRKQFSYQMASLTFMTYIMHIYARFPHKISISRATGNVWGTELIPALFSNKPVFHNPEPVPFRLTPNIQTLMGPLATEGLFTAALLATARSLTDPENGGELEQQLSIFVRDEMIFWFTQQHKGGPDSPPLRDSTTANCETVVKRAISLAQFPDGNLPATQSVVDWISRAVNPQFLAGTDALWMGYL